MDPGGGLSKADSRVEIAPRVDSSKAWTATETAAGMGLPVGTAADGLTVPSLPAGRTATLGGVVVADAWVLLGAHGGTLLDLPSDRGVWVTVSGTEGARSPRRTGRIPGPRRTSRPSSYKGATDPNS